MALLIQKIKADSIAEQAGLLINDVLLRGNGVELERIYDITDIAAKDDDKIQLEFIRAGELQTIEMSGRNFGLTLETGTYQETEPEPTPAGFTPHYLPTWPFTTRYGISQIVSTLGIILGWMVVLAGIVVLSVQGKAGLWSAITLALAGIGIVQVAQISRALTDTADHTREIMNILSRK